MGLTTSSHVAPIESFPVNPSITEDPVRCLCNYVKTRDIDSCKRLFKQLSWDEIVEIDTAQVQRRRTYPLMHLWMSSISRLHEGRNTADLPMHVLLTNSQTGKYDRKHYKLFKVLLKYGYDTDIQDFRGNSALHIAIGRGQLYNVVVYEVKFLRKHKHYTLKFIKGLCESGCQVNIHDNLKRQSPLHLAAKYNMYSCIEVLLVYGACINQQDFQGKTPLILAIEQGCLESVACLLCYLPDVHIRTSEFATALHLAAHVNTILPQFESYTVQKLLDHGAHANAQDINGDTPLHIAARTRGSTEIIIRLLRNGADPALRNKRGLTPFYEYVTNEKLFPSNLENDSQLIPLLSDNVYRTFRAFLARLPRQKPNIIRDPNNVLPRIFQLDKFQMFEALVESFGTTYSAQTLQSCCVQKIRNCIGVRKLVDSSITLWKLGLPKPLQELVCSERFRSAMEIPI